MDTNSIAEKLKLLIWLFILVLVLVFLAFSGEMQGGFYVLLRWVLAAVFVFAAIVFNEMELKKQTVTFSIFAVVYNPIIPLYLGLDLWTLVNVITFIYVAASLYLAIKIRKSLPKDSSSGGTT